MNEVLVSVDSSELQRTTLERKKADELHTIAAALGVKPGSRAKKAEVVDLILSATRGATSGDGPAAEPSGGRGSSGGSRPGRGASAAAKDNEFGKDNESDSTNESGKDNESDSTTSSAGNGAAPVDEVEQAVQSAARRRAPRSVGWAGDETGQATPTDVVESASLFDTPSAAQGRSRAAAAAKNDDGGANGNAANGRATNGTGPDASAGGDSDTKTTDKSDNRGDGDRNRNNRNGRSNDGGQRSDGDDADTPKQGDASKQDASKQDASKQSGDGNNSDGNNSGNNNNNNRNEGEGSGRRRRRRGRDRGDRNDNNRNRNDRDDGRDRNEETSSEPVPITGHLDLRDEGYGFLRINGFVPSRDDAYVSVRQVRQFGLRKGDYITGASRPAGYKEKNPALLRIDTVNGVDPEEAKKRPRFEDLTPLFPDQKLTMEMPGDPTNMTARIIDLMSPIGKGQRGLIVSPPKAGKTTIMKQIARSIEVNNPEVHLIVLLVDERPEEVTDMKRWLVKGEVAASTFDRPAEEHIHVAELTIERAKRLVETGKDVCIILDGITRLARAYNLGAPASGRIMSGGIDTGALYPPKKFFGAARNIEEGGSLTVLATALVDTGSRMDEVIFEEFKGTGNMELRLDRRLAERRIYPAIDVDASSTRHEELLFERKQLQQVWKLRRVLSGLRGEGGDGGAAAGLELLIDRLKTFKDNDEFLAEVAKGPTIG